MNLIQFGEDVKGYEIRVLNEREIRAAAGVLFVIMLVAVMIVVLKWDFTLLKIASTLFLVDILIRVFVNPRFSPTLILGRIIVRNQVPEYVGAQQKKFAWMIGVVLAGIMFVSLVLLNYHAPINGIICLLCLIFLFCETSFGICIGCKVYALVYGEKAKYCPGEVCEPQSRHPIQKISFGQIIILLAFIAGTVLITISFEDNFRRDPVLSNGMEKSPHQH